MAECTVKVVWRAAVLCGLLFTMNSMSVGSELRLTPIVKAVQKARPSVVNIHSEKTLTTTDNRFGNFETSRRVNGMGTGVVLDERGYLITNHHVIDGVEKIRVTLHDGSTFLARLIAFDKETDLALIKIEIGKDLPTITIGTSNDLMPGEPVIAVGNAYGYEHTVTRGIISALNRTVQLNDTQQYSNLIQTDASINPGNSGGPLLNIDGEMIGINVAVRAGAQGIGFAIPVDKALAIASELLASTHRTQFWHGIVEDESKPNDSGGVLVSELAPESPAATAGMLKGDLVVAANDQTVSRNLDLERALLESKSGEEISVEIKRDGKKLNLTLTLAAVSSSHKLASHNQVWELLGLKCTSSASKDLLQKNSRYRGGLLVDSLRPNGPAARQGIKEGDILVGLHIWETVTLDNVTHILNRPEVEQLNPLKFYVVRNGKTLYGYLSIDLP